jgi:hypothetical protein
MNDYEQQITLSILNKLPNIIKNAITDSDDRYYLFYYLTKIFNKIIDSLQNFQLQPIATYSSNVEVMIARLISFRYFLDKICDSLDDKNFEIKTITNTSKEIITVVKEAFDNTEQNLTQLNQLEEKLKLYIETKESGNIWQKMKVGFPPRYTLKDIEHSKDEAKNEFFLSIVHLAKKHSDNMVYVEFDCNEILNEYYRHYAIADEKMAIARLPKVLRLPEDKKTFNIQETNEAIHHNVFTFDKKFVS